MRKTANELIQLEYDRLAGIYDFVFGAILQPGRERAIHAMPLEAGTRVLELGIGTGLTIPLYPRGWHVAGVDLTASMLKKARTRSRQSRGARITLVRADAALLPFADDSFDAVLVPYTISVVPAPLRVVLELRRVCRATGRIILLNHFLSDHPIGSRLERSISPITRRVGFRSDLPLRPLLAKAGLRLVSVERVNVPPLWKLVTCVKDQ